MKRYELSAVGYLKPSKKGEWFAAKDVKKRLTEIRRLLESSHVADNQFRLGVLGAQDIRMAIDATNFDE